MLRLVYIKNEVGERLVNPQTENGFTRIANEILDAVIRTQFIATHLKIILVCWRYLYGFNRKQAELSEGFISKATGISKRYIAKELKALIDANVIIIIRESTYTSPRILSFNKNYEEWKYRTTLQQLNCTPIVESQDHTTVEPQDHTTVELQFIQEKKTLKKTLKKEIYDDFFELLWKLYPRKEGKGQVSILQKERLYEIGIEQMTRCIERYKKAKLGTERQFLQYGSTFFNRGYVDYLDENYVEPEQTKTFKDKPPQTGNFTQRKYDDDYYEKLYKNKGSV